MNTKRKYRAVRIYTWKGKNKAGDTIELSIIATNYWKAEEEMLKASEKIGFTPLEYKGWDEKEKED